MQAEVTGKLKQHFNNALPKQNSTTTGSRYHGKWSVWSAWALQVRPDCSADSEPCRTGRPSAPLVWPWCLPSSLHGKDGLACERQRRAKAPVRGVLGWRGCVGSTGQTRSLGPARPFLGSVDPGLWRLSQLCFPLERAPSQAGLAAKGNNSLITQGFTNRLFVSVNDSFLGLGIRNS